MKKRILSFALALCFVLTLIPTAFADSAPTSGECGDNLTWTLDSNGTLTISGTGEMWHYNLISDIGSDRTSAPWGKSYSSITSVVINDGITSIGSGAFSGCSSLTSVTIPDSVTSIGWGAFSDCSSLTSVTIPKSVTSIEWYAFSDCSSLTSVTITDGVTSIGEAAFCGCSSLKSVMIPDSVTSIKGGAFSFCSSLESVTIPDSVTSIGDEAFFYCSSLASVTIPNSVTSIGYQAFYGCSSLASVTIPNSVTSIGDYAFYGCSSLASVTIPDSVTNIEAGAFDSCGNLTSITVDKGNEYYCSDNGVLFSKDKTELHTYPAGKSNTSYTIPRSVTSIGWGAFSDCSSLTSVTIGNGVRSIGDYAFWRCSSLTSITVDNNNKYFCSDNGVLFNKDKTELHTYPAGKSNTSYTIPKSVTSIGYHAFYYCSRLTSVTIPDSVTSIGGWAFSGCSSLTSITIPASVTSIGDSVFRRCDSLTSVTIPDSVTSIGDGAFWDCTNLTSITIPASVTSIGDSVFRGCESLTDVYYGGNAAQWKAISIGDDNYPLFDATIHYAGEPAAPAAPVIKITTSAGKPKISWSKVDGAAKYKVFYSTDGKKYYQLIETTKTSVTHTKAKIGTKYYYKVKAVNSGAESEFSNDVNIKCRPAAPTVTISRSGGKAKLSWKAVSGADKYYIYRSTDGKTFKYYEKTTKTSFTDSKSASGKKYYYKVKAVTVVNGKAIVSGYSNVKSITTTLAKPTVKITTSNGKPKLSWSKVTGADKYYIYRSTDGKTFKHFATTTKLSYTNTSAKKGTKYYYKVKAVYTANTNANSAFSTVVSIKATK